MKILRTVVLMVVVTGLVYTISSCGNNSQVLSENEQAQIYAAVIRQVYTIDHTFGVGNSPNFPVIYLPQATDDISFDPDSTQSRSEVLSKSLRDTVISRLDDLPAEFIWITDKKEVILSDSSVMGHGAIITLGNIYSQKDGSVKVNASIYIANLGGGGFYYVLEQIDNEWKITGKGMRWIS